ncbi:MAG: hypothetical protein H6650_06620 [Ardenticatenales bacterium]|nr:hypothetical protein [Ardenticatenales bacterium]
MDRLEYDVIVLTADNDMEWTVRTLLEMRTRALGIRRVNFSLQRHPNRDNGVFHDSPDFLRLYVNRAQNALVLLDREGSGQERLSAVEIEEDVESRLQKNGWKAERSAVVVLDPELEVWVWSDSPHVPRILGLEPAELELFLSTQPHALTGKPQKPKEALQQVLRISGRPFSARIFQELAQAVSLRTDERAFNKLRNTLQTWFPP